MSKVEDFFTGLLMLLGLILIALIWTGHVAQGFYAKSVIATCEEELPRSQTCRVTAEPIPMEQVNE